ncbi:hypothetical protein PVK06_005662 [Gossypium arboreum]|uniref:DUF4283 domain-containing protein n=1 Tax=Gossypium arboreum TaxID=29729 RepID=A0ABR0QW77_GOSAR|nr:hypothetical protein PVK06_005662 [Gossypium arboreum]
MGLTQEFLLEFGQTLVVKLDYLMLRKRIDDTATGEGNQTRFHFYSFCFCSVTHSVGLECDSPSLHGAFVDAIMAEDINRLLMKLIFSEEEATRVMSTKCLFNMVPYIKDQEIKAYAFNHSPFWVRISNIPMEYMDRLIALEMGNAIGEVITIDWRDKDGGWADTYSLKLKSMFSSLCIGLFNLLTVRELSLFVLLDTNVY